jgi:hypothetical protein
VGNIKVSVVAHLFDAALYLELTAWGHFRVEVLYTFAHIKPDVRHGVLGQLNQDFRKVFAQNVFRHLRHQPVDKVYRMYTDHKSLMLAYVANFLGHNP